MAKFLRYLFIVLILVSSLSCQAVYRAAQAPAAPELKIAAHGLQPPASPTPTRTLPPPTPTPSPTPLPPTPTATPLASPTVSADLTSLQLRVFEDLWQTIRDEYLYSDFNGLDWDAVYEEYRLRIEAGLAPEDFYASMSELVYSLGDEHSSYLRPEEVVEEQAEFAGEKEYIGIGVLTSPVPGKNSVTVIVVFPDSPAEEAGLQPHDSILAVDGQPVLEGDIDRRTLMLGEEGTAVDLTVQSPGQEPRQISLVRRNVEGSVPVPYQLLTGPQGKRIGYVLLATFADATIDDKVQEALVALSAEGPLDGLILDNRQNTGGIDEVTAGTLGYFTSGVVGYFVNRQEQRAFNIFGSDVNGSLGVPLVVLVGPNTASFAEIFSGILKDTGRATIVGEVTGGNVEILWGFSFEDGSRAWIAHDTFRPLHNSQEDWEETGIVPHIQVGSSWDEVTIETDPALIAAMGHLAGVGEGQELPTPPLFTLFSPSPLW